LRAGKEQYGYRAIVDVTLAGRVLSPCPVSQEGWEALVEGAAERLVDGLAAWAIDRGIRLLCAVAPLRVKEATDDLWPALPIR